MPLRILTRLSRRRRALLLVSAGLLVGWLCCLPRPLVQAPYSLVVEDRNGELLGARIAEDGQWRFPATDSLPDKLVRAIVTFEDKRFFRHPGVDVRAIGRALRQNMRAGEIVSGGSTLTMQVMRLAAARPPRTLWRKLLEAAQALRLELTHDKATILQLWAAHAPFGGNVVGAETAAWRYFNKPLAYVSWGEAATLAVLPNSPGLMHPGRNRAALLAKRNRLLDKLAATGQIDTVTWQLAQAEPLPADPYPLPQLAPHLLDRIAREHAPDRYRTTVDEKLQLACQTAVAQHADLLAANQIHNAAALIVDIESGATVAYVGNVPDLSDAHSPAVDLITAPRSPGSLLKPVLYSLALQEGRLLPQAWLPDVPQQFSGFRPENFQQRYDGVVPADQALSHSLNIPFVELLQDYGVARFHRALQDWTFGQITRPPDHYGLSLILGGCEVTLWEAVGWYSSLARTVRGYPQRQSRYGSTDWRLPHYRADALLPESRIRRAPQGVGAGAGWLTLQALLSVNRPDEEGEWQRFVSSRQTAWKTGTSHGFRDAWAVGVTGKYVVGVWVGNADGEGRSGLIGTRAAAPLLFRLVKLLPDDAAWYAPPYDDLIQRPVCRTSGYLPQPFCPVDTAWLPRRGDDAPPCPYHRTVTTDAQGDYRLTAHCAQAPELYQRTYLELSPLEEYFYRRRHPTFEPMPPWRPDCTPATGDEQVMQLIYPRAARRIKVPRDLNGEVSATVFSLAHRDPHSTVFWHLDTRFVGQTQDYHTLQLTPTPGPHQLVVVDEQGHRLEQHFEVIE